MEESRRLLEFRNISKNFPGVKAIDDVSMSFFEGEIVALLGENGAGKSTLMKILSGAYIRDGGDIILDEEILPHVYSPSDARKFGIAIIYQELSLISELTVMENIYLTHEPKSFPNVIDFKKMNQMARNQLDKLGANVDPQKNVKELPLSEKQMVEIAKALAVDCKVIVMDEPTTSLTWEDSAKLFDIIRKLKKQKITVIYISHRLDEIFQICDRAIVMRDGVVVGEKRIKECSQDEIIELMCGKVLQADLKPQKASMQIVRKEKILEAEHFSDGKFINDINLSIYKGEILGIGGLIGSKRTELFRMICGIDPKQQGILKIKDRVVSIRNAEDAIKNGLGYLSENRKEDGLSLGLSVEENIVQSNYQPVNRYGIVSWEKVEKISNDFIKTLNIKGNSSTKVINLSGGNQQKVSISKWLHAECDILIFDEPTKGIDVNSKAEIHQLIRDFVKNEGKAAVVISSDINELLAVSDRLLIMSKGKIVGEFFDGEIEETSVLKCVTTKGI